MGVIAMLEIDLRDLADKKHGGQFSVTDVRYAHGKVVIELEPTIEDRGSSEYMYKRNWQAAHIFIPIDVVPKMVEAVVSDWRRLYAKSVMPG
jgi:hypothetical protein